MTAKNSPSLVSMTCQRCGHKWLPRVIPVVQCPRCRSGRWNTPRPAPKQAGETTNQAQEEQP